MKERLKLFLKKFKILILYAYNNIIQGINYIVDSLDMHQETIRLYFDSNKAFEIVNHDVLLENLYKKQNSQFIFSYLKNRIQKVMT